MQNATRYIAEVSLNTSNYGDDNLNPDDGDVFQTHQDIPLVRTAADFSAAFAAGLKTVAVIATTEMLKMSTSAPYPGSELPLLQHSQCLVLQ
jgi:hypothetical protein